MPLVAPMQTSFNAGEFSPLAYGRVDYPKYKNGTALMQNFVPLVQGGVTRRTGTAYVAPTYDNAVTRLVPFVFSNGDAFMLEFSDLKLRFYRNRAPVLLTAQNISAITQADPAVLTYTGTDTYANGDEVYLSGIAGMTELNGRRFIVANVDTGANTFELQDLFAANIDSTGYTAYSSGGTVEEVYTVTTTYTEAELPFLRFQQSQDVMYIAHPDHKPSKLSRAAVTSWSFADVDFLDGPYLKINDTTTTLTPAATSGSGVNVTASSVTGINDGAGFQTTDVGRLIRIKHSTTWGYAKITSRTSTTVVVVTILSNFGATTASSTWRLGEWSDTTGYPSIVFSFEDRLGWGASAVAPVTINLSKTEDYENMAPTATDSVVTADNALQLRLNSKQQDPIRWVYDDEKGMLVGTKGAEWLVRASTTGEAMSAINFPSARRSTKHGSANIEPVEVGKAVLFAQTAGRKIRELAYVYEVDGFRAPDLTVLAEHATKSGIAQMVYAQEPHGIVWVRRKDGQLWGMTYDREQDVIGWHRHVIGGVSDASDNATTVESIATIPSPDGSQNDLWVVCKRYIDGQTVRYVEYLTDFNTDYDDVADCFFLDCGKTITLGSPSATLTGLWHLEGETVTMLVDGKPTTDKTVTSGSVTMDITGTTKVHVGLNYKSRLKTLRPDAGSATGTAQGKLKRHHKLAGRFHQTVGCWIGREFDNAAVPMDAVDFRPGNHNMGQAVPLYTGDKVLDFEDDYTLDGQLCFETRQATPCTLLAFMPQFVVQDAA